MGQVALPRLRVRTSIVLTIHQVSASHLGSALFYFDKRGMRATKKHEEDDDEYSKTDAEEMEFPAFGRIGVSYVFRRPAPLRAQCIQNH